MSRFCYTYYMNILYIVVGIVVVAVVWAIAAYNRLVTLSYRGKEALSDIDVQLKRRYDLIPNLIETVKGYAAHEQGVFQKVTEARARAMGAEAKGNPKEMAMAEHMLSGTLKSLFALSENYPDLKANANFLELQRELSDTENKIQAARRFYNSTVMALGTAIDTFPTNLVARQFRFGKMEFFEAGADEQAPISVKF